jgi:hypothetical protein
MNTQHDFISGLALASHKDQGIKDEMGRRALYAFLESLKADPETYMVARALIIDGLLDSNLIVASYDLSEQQVLNSLRSIRLHLKKPTNRYRLAKTAEDMVVESIDELNNVITLLELEINDSIDVPVDPIADDPSERVIIDDKAAVMAVPRKDSDVASAIYEQAKKAIEGLKAVFVDLASRPPALVPVADSFSDSEVAQHPKLWTLSLEEHFDKETLKKELPWAEEPYQIEVLWKRDGHTNQFVFSIKRKRTSGKYENAGKGVLIELVYDDLREECLLTARDHEVPLMVDSSDMADAPRFFIAIK